MGEMLGAQNKIKSVNKKVRAAKNKISRESQT